MSHATGKAVSFLLFVVVLVLPTPSGMAAEAHRLVAVTVLMAALWLTQAIPIAATSLIPLVAFPLSGIQSASSVSRAYSNESVFLFLGGFILALGIEKWGLHRRAALHIVRLVGTGQKRVMLGFMLASACLSMWISNTATTLLMLPIAVAFLDSLREATQAKGSKVPASGQATAKAPSASFQRLSVRLLLSIAYASSIGGFTTLVGTPTNVQFRLIWANQFPRGPEIGAGPWMVAVVPVGVVMLFCAWGTLAWRLPGDLSLRSIGRGYFTRCIRQLGPPRPTEILMLVVLSLTALLWICRKPMSFGATTILPGWGPAVEQYLLWLGTEPDFARTAVGDSTVAILMALVMFLLPAGKDSQGRPQALMDWKTARKLPWAILLLIGGGFALADAFTVTGLSQFIGERFAEFCRGLPAWTLVVGVCLLLTFLTEFTSNVATISALLPVLAATSIGIGIDPRLLMVPATLSTTCAFMLPIGTPPNAVVFSSGKVSMSQMARHGFVLNLVGVVVISVATFAYLVPQLGISLDTLPDWAVPANDLGTQKP